MNAEGYEIVRKLGEGGMSEVYEAVNVRFGSRHALKVFTYAKDDETVRDRFVCEGRLLAKWHHPGIVGVTDAGCDTETGRPFFVMDLVLDGEGRVRTLADVQNEGVTEEQVGCWYDDLREALAYIHAQGVVHRDLKLQNVLIGPNGHAVLTDFGISRIGGGQDGPAVDPVHTIIDIRDGRKPVMGSIGYMAPELELGVAATPQSDYYALGVLVFKLLTGTWCDRNTNLEAELDTYDPVWKRILPKLLHANPQARECLSYAQERSAAQERQLAVFEERWIAAKNRGHFARHAARYLLLLVCLLSAGIGWMMTHPRLAAVAGAEAEPVAAANSSDAFSFEALFRIPEEAPEEDVFNEEGDLVMPSRDKFIDARLDFFALTQRRGVEFTFQSASPEEKKAWLEELRVGLSEDGEMSPFNDMEFGGMSYNAFGENDVLRRFVDLALERLEKGLAQ